MFDDLKQKFHVKMFYRYHSSYYIKWLNSISKCDLTTLEEELEAIRWKKEYDVGNENYDYQIEMLNEQESIVRSLIEEIKKGIN